MRFLETRIKGAFTIEPEPIRDKRGFFMEAWKLSEAKKHGIQQPFIRSNISFNQFAGTLRGLHAQRNPHAEDKLVRCTRGRIWDVLVDARPDSPTYQQWYGAELTADNRRMLYIPKGCLHGFLTLEDESEVYYEVSAPYHPEAEVGARYDDPAFDIEWPPVENLTLSDKDQRWPLFTR